MWDISWDFIFILCLKTFFYIKLQICVEIYNVICEKGLVSCIALIFKVQILWC